MKSKGIHSMFAPAEKFAEMLEEAGASRAKLGTAQDVSNRDNAGKQAGVTLFNDLPDLVEL